MKKKRIKWYQLNIYPTTARGSFTVALVQKFGYHYHCAKHQKNTCKDCVDFGTSELAATWHGVESEDIDIYEVLRQAAVLVSEDPHNKYPRSGRMPPITPAP